jgi:hypothetical protein
MRIFLSSHQMFRIQINGLWSRDYVTPLARVLCDTIPCSLEDAIVRIRELADGKRLSVNIATIGKANAVACDMLQYGCYIEVDQVAPLTDEAMIADFEDWFDPELSAFDVVYDATGKVSKIIDERAFAYMRIESQVVTNYVGKELLKRGAQQLDEFEWPEVQKRLKKATAENEIRRTSIRARRAEYKRMHPYDDPEALDQEE